MTTRAVAHVLLLLLCGAPLPAGAQAEPPPAGPALDEEAQRLSDQALEAYRAGNYNGAERLYQQAYNLRPDPALLYNLGRTYEKLGQPAAALDYYRRYIVSEGTEVKLRARAEARVVELAKQEGAGMAARPAEKPEAAPPPPGRRLLWAGVGLAAAGVAGMAVGGGLSGAAGAAYSDFMGTTDELDKRAARDRAEALRSGAIAGYVVGGALLAGGAALLGVGLWQGRGHERRGTLSLAPLPGGGAAVWTGAF